MEHNQVEDVKEPTIVAAHVDEITEAMKQGNYDNIPKVQVAFSDNTEAKLFEFYPDELQFTADEFIGLTREQALKLKEEKLNKL